ncbi:MAG: right-handed parallel beta-helix repeat-containing protein [Pseudonocardiaceae bacterium]
MALAYITALLVPAVPAQATTSSVDASLKPGLNLPEGVGNRADPHLAWTNRTFSPCNRWVVASPDGTGGGSGLSQTDPWRSLKYAFAQAKEGNFVCVAGGTYKENHIVPAATGTWDKPITFLTTGAMSIVPDTVKTGADYPVFDFGNNSLPSMGYWILDGFTIDRQQRDGPGVRLEGHGANEVDENGVDNPSAVTGAVHHIIIQNMKIRNGKAGQGILVRGRVHDTLLRRNTIENFQRWMTETPVNPSQPNGQLRFDDPQYTHASDKHYRWDAHGVAVEGMMLKSYTPPMTSQEPSPQPTRASVKRLRVDLNTFKNNGGDGLQCLGSRVAETRNDAGDPMDIAIVDNKVVNDIANPTVFNQNVSEDGFDIKSCQYLTISGSSSPLSTNANASSVKEFRPTTMRYDAVRNNNNSNGAGIVIHQFARNILIENNRISNACGGILVGTEEKKVQAVLIRNNLIENNYYRQVQPGGDTDDQGRCRGRGIQLTNANHVDVYNNTLSNVPTTGIQLSADIIVKDPATIPNNVDIWNNIITHTTTTGAEPRLWVDIVNEGTAIDSNYNLFWHPGLTQTGANYNRFKIAETAHDPRSWTMTGQPESSVPSVYRVGNPLFIDLTNYYTQAGSPARDRALNSLNKTYCGSGLDRGYIESCQ